MCIGFNPYKVQITQCSKQRRRQRRGFHKVKKKVFLQESVHTHVKLSGEGQQDLGFSQRLCSLIQLNSTSDRHNNLS